ncbi:MAG: hypothetical protein U0807_00820 [Candidatus Binatia bacterium]
MVRPILALALALVSAGPACAHHRQTPPVVQFNKEGDADLTRASAADGAFATVLVTPTDRTVVRYKLLGADATVVIAESGQNGDPSVSFNGSSVAYMSEADPLGLGLPGQQVYQRTSSALTLVSQDPTGTSTNPVVSANGKLVAFESRGDMASTGNSGAQQVFVYQAGRGLQQVSRGLGRSGNASLDKAGKNITFESTSDPATWLDAGTAQVWHTYLLTGEAHRITSGLGVSRKPAISVEGQVIVFESTADLAGTGADTGIPQIFAHDLKSGTTARITEDATGCTDPSVHRFRTDWRIGFMCGGQPYFYLLRADQRSRIQVDGGETSRVLMGMGPQFLLVSTTAPLLTGGTTPTADRRVYLVNLYHRPAEVVPGTAVWFPTRGITPLH